MGARTRRAREFAVPGDVLIALAQFAGQTVASAAITDLWESARERFARLLGRGDARRTQVADRWLAGQITFVPADQNHIAARLVQAGKFASHLSVFSGDQDSHARFRSVLGRRGRS